MIAIKVIGVCKMIDSSVLWWIMQDNCWYYTVADSRGTRYILYFWDGLVKNDVEVVDYVY